MFGGELMNVLRDSDMGKAIAKAVTPELLLRSTKKMMWSMVRYRELQMMYDCALKTIKTKFEVLDSEFEARYKRNPIKTISTRLKSTESIVDKLERYKKQVTLENMINYVNDFAGIRVVCSYIDDIYRIADSLLKQDDVTLITKKDYIKDPKGNGYRSLHLIVSIPVFFAARREEIKIEVQIRTIAMDFWASLEHQLKYKREAENQKQINEELSACAEIIAATDERMLALRRRIEEAEDMPTEEDILFERLRKSIL
ncbi:MAG: GTP pyrophosphokinase family protein [Clostridia bacterium]|nr:GTP pyrophosphokinase family protein [Clostridia bacterium]